jgi:uncharacterized membrane protein YphA (DoxX/SURF4 family)
MFREKQADELAFLVLRLGLAGLFIWFGLDKFIHPDAWVAWIPTIVLKNLPVSTTAFLALNALFEIGVGAALLSGHRTREAALLGALFLAILPLFLGANEVTIRDTALLGGMLAIASHENALAKKPLPEQWFSWAVSGFALYMLVIGVLYLRNG